MGDLQLYEPLDAATEAALRSSIRRFGVIYPVIVSKGPWKPGCVIDGHHRSRLAKELGISFDQKHRRVRNEEEAIEIARTCNEDRRHMPVDLRRPFVTELRQEGHSLRAIAGAAGVSHTQVRRDLDAAADEGIGTDVPMPDKVQTSDGRSYPTSRPPAAAAPADPSPESEPCRVDPIRPDRPTVRSRREPSETERPESPVNLGLVFATLYESFGQAMHELAALSPEQVALTFTGTTGQAYWQLVKATRDWEIQRVIDWFDALLAARPEPFSVVEGGRG